MDLHILRVALASPRHYIFTVLIRSLSVGNKLVVDLDILIPRILLSAKRFGMRAFLLLMPAPVSAGMWFLKELGEPRGNAQDIWAQCSSKPWRTRRIDF